MESAKSLWKWSSKLFLPDSLSTLNNGVSLRSWILWLPPLEQRSSMWRASPEGVNLKILEQTHCMIFWFIETAECPSLTAWWWSARLEGISSVPWFTISAPLLPVRFGCFMYRLDILHHSALSMSFASITHIIDALAEHSLEEAWKAVRPRSCIWQHQSLDVYFCWCKKTRLDQFPSRAWETQQSSNDLMASMSHDPARSSSTDCSQEWSRSLERHLTISVYYKKHPA